MKLLKLFVACVFITIIFLSSPAKASASTYYVAKTGNDSNAGTEASPFLTIGKGLTVLSAGDTLYVKSGSYNETFQNTIPSGSSWDLPVTVKAYPGDAPIITYDSSLHVVNMISDTQYVVMDGFEISGGLAGVRVRSNSGHLKFYNMTVHDCANQGMTFDGDVGDIEVAGAKVYDCGDILGEHGFYLNDDDIIIRDSEIYSNRDAGIKFQAGLSDIYIYNNLIYGNQQSGIEANSSGGGEHYVYNNIFATNQTAAIDFQTNSANYNIYNNLFIENAVGVRGRDSSGAVVDINLANNIFYQNTTGIYLSNYAHDISSTNDLFYGNDTNITDLNSALVQTGAITGSDPLLQKISEGYYVPQSSSPVVDAGTDLSSIFTTDYFDVSRPQGTAFDIGPFEYVPDAAQTLAGALSQTDWSKGRSGGTITNTVFNSQSNINFRTAGQITLEKQSITSSGTFDEDDTGWVSQIIDSGSTPSSVSNLYAWFKADQITGLSDDDPVDTWADQSGNGYDLTKATDALRPIYSTNDLFGQPTLVGDGTKGLQLSSTHFLDNFTVFWVVSTNSTGVNCLLGNGDNKICSRPETNGFEYWFDTGGSVGVGTINTGEYYIFEVNRNGTSLYARNNSTASTTKTIGSSQFQWKAAFAYRYFNNAFNSAINGNLAEFAVYNTSLSSSDELAVIRHLGNKYAITLPTYVTTNSVNYDMQNFNNSLRSYKYVTATYGSNLLVKPDSSSSNKHNIEAYVYTDGSAVTSSDVELYAVDTTVTTSFEATDYSGWYRVYGTVDTVDSSSYYGVQVKADKTVFVDDFNIYTYSAGTLTSSIYDTGQEAQWTEGYIDGSTPNDSTYSLKVRTGNSSDLSDAKAFSSCSAITLGADMSDNSCVTDGHRYVQYQLTLTPSTNPHTPTVTDVRIGYLPNFGSTDYGVSPNTCLDTTPPTAPDLFQIYSSETAATLYFTPVETNNTGYYLSFGETSEAEDYGASLTLGNQGVQTYTVNLLDPSKIYYFKVRGQNGCAPGPWSEVVSAATNITTVQIPGSSVLPQPKAKEDREMIIEKLEEIDSELPSEESASFKTHDVAIYIHAGGKPLQGVDVELHSTPKYGRTDQDGKVLLADVENGEHTLFLSYDGYKSQRKVLIDSEEKDISINIEVELVQEMPSWVYYVISGLIIIILILGYKVFRTQRN